MILIAKIAVNIQDIFNINRPKHVAYLLFKHFKKNKATIGKHPNKKKTTKNNVTRVLELYYVPLIFLSKILSFK